MENVDIIIKYTTMNFGLDNCWIVDVKILLKFFFQIQTRFEEYSCNLKS